MAFEGLGGDVLDVVDALAQELLGGGGNGDVVALDLDLGDAVHLDRDAFAGVNLGGLHIDGQQFQRKDIDFLEDRPNEHAAAFDDAEAAHATVPSGSTYLALRPETTSTWFGPTLV